MKVSELYSKRSRWTTGHAALNTKGNYCAPTSPEAVKWCLIGAIEKCYPNNIKRQQVLVKTLEKIKEYGYSWIHRFNDDTSFKEVKNLVKELDI